MKKLIFLISMTFCIMSCTQNSGDKSLLTGSENTAGSRDSLTVDKLDFALEFINGYVDDLKKNESATDLVDWANSNKLVTPEFKKDLSRIVDEANRENPEIGLEYDPIFDAQDYPSEGFELLSLDPVSNLVYLRGKDWNEFKLTLKAKCVDGVWLVDGCGSVNVPEKDRDER